MATTSAEHKRLAADRNGEDPWRRFGPYLSERQWGTVREDYSAYGTAWDSFTHDMARSRAYRWGEDGLAGFCDDQQLVCLGLALWNTRDDILKERLFGLTGPEGNHGEDVKELYYYLDAVPSGAYQRMLYKYPQAPFPYAQLVEENRRRGRSDPEFELIDTGVFDEDRYFDVFVEYVKQAPEDILIRVRVCNRGPVEAPLVVMPQIWCRNTWAWGRESERPLLQARDDRFVDLSHPVLGSFVLHGDNPDEVILCDNETNTDRLFGVPRGGFHKDGFHDYLVNGLTHAINPIGQGTKAGMLWRRTVAPYGEVEFRLRLARRTLVKPFSKFEDIIATRRREADAFYQTIHPAHLSDAQRQVQRQALAGMLWSQQFYNYDVQQWLDGDPAQPPPPASRRQGRNHEWSHLNNADIVSMPDTWEYPWYAAWDLAFHTVPLALVDVELAKRQLLLLTREWYMHPSGQLPAYEWAFSDVNPPVHAWAAWKIFALDRAKRGDAGDLDFLERMMHKLLLNFTWWVNRKDANGLNLFQGGFLGLDNIGIFDRSAPLPVDGHIEQADGTAWMAMYALNLMRMSIELAQHRPAYEDIATKFFEHFLHIAGAMSNVDGHGIDMWNAEDGFFYDVLHDDDPENDGYEHIMPVRIRSLVGLVPLFAVETITEEMLDRLPAFRARMNWFLEHRPDLAALVSRWRTPGSGSRHLLSLLRGHRMKRLLKRMLDETEFLSEFGVRALSKYHLDHPYRLEFGGMTHTVTYQPGESDTGTFGGNSNWRGPIWMPMNYLLVDSLRSFHEYYGDDFLVECPTGSGVKLNLKQIADELSTRLCRLFLPRADGTRPCLGLHPKFQTDPNFRDHLLFHEYFHGDNGRGVGASHQTGWTGLVASLLAETAPPRRPSARRKARP